MKSFLCVLLMVISVSPFFLRSKDRPRRCIGENCLANCTDEGCCLEGRCCSSAVCNDCFIRCDEKCDTSSCITDCAGKCISDEIKHTADRPDYIDDDGEVTSTTEEAVAEKTTDWPKREDAPCCYVIHPKQCFTWSAGNKTEMKCVINKHYECSSICSSPVVLVKPNPPVSYPFLSTPSNPCPWYYPNNYWFGNSPCSSSWFNSWPSYYNSWPMANQFYYPYTVPNTLWGGSAQNWSPQMVQVPRPVQPDPSTLQQNDSPNNCRPLDRPPWFECNKYQTEDCSKCYFCEGNYNPSSCSRSLECSQSCRENFFYNIFMSSIRSGMNCTLSNNSVQCN